MTVKYYIDSENKYIGAFDGSEAPPGSTEVGHPPSNAAATWNGSSWDEPVIVPQTVEMRQARLALLANGHLVTVESAIDGLAEPSRTASLIDWNFARTVQRDNALTQAMITILSLTEQQADDLFIQAAAIA